MALFSVIMASYYGSCLPYVIIYCCFGSAFEIDDLKNGMSRWETLYISRHHGLDTSNIESLKSMP